MRNLDQIQNVGHNFVHFLMVKSIFQLRGVNQILPHGSLANMNIQSVFKNKLGPSFHIALELHSQGNTKCWSKFISKYGPNIHSSFQAIGSI